jgi:imidazolonepropionase-like amidohydrolase
MGNFLIEGGTLIDGFGGDPVPNPGIRVEGRIIRTFATFAGASPEEPERDRCTVIDATGRFITPGLIDGHVHLSMYQGALPGIRYTSSAEYSTLWSAHCLPTILRAGVTSISVPGGKWFVDVTLRDAVDAGLLLGPRIFCAGRVLTPYGGIFDSIPPWETRALADAVGVLCNGADEYVREVRRQAKHGVNLIKVADDYWGDVQGVSLQELSATVDEAHRHGIRVAIHSRGAGTTRTAALAGVDWIFHADFASKADLEVVAEKQIPIMPAFTQCYLRMERGGAGAARQAEQLEVNLEAIRLARSMGIEILVGTDTGNDVAFESGRYHGREAGILVREIGLSPMDALVANTRLNARVVGLEGQLGAIAGGYLADIVLWDADPVADIDVIADPSHVVAVIKDGEVVDPSSEAFLRLTTEPPKALNR